jgi:hypothetical protein
MLGWNDGRPPSAIRGAPRARLASGHYRQPVNCAANRRKSPLLLKRHSSVLWVRLTVCEEKMEKDPDAGLPDQAMPAILMHHPISAYEEDPYDITVHPERFGQQMRWLRRAGRKGASVGQLLEAQGRDVITD